MFKLQKIIRAIKKLFLNYLFVYLLSTFIISYYQLKISIPNQYHYHYFQKHFSYHFCQIYLFYHLMKIPN